MTSLGRDVKEYGAAGNGVTLDTAAFQAALADTSVSRVCVGPGVYLLHEITVSRPLTLEMARDATLRLADNQNTNVVTVTADHVSILGGKVDGNKANQTAGTTAGVYISGASHTTLDRVTAENCYVDGVAVRDGSDHWRVTRCVLSGNGAMGFRSHTGVNGYVSGCFASGNDHSGFDFDAFSKDSTIEGCHASNNANGVFVEEGSSHITVCNCVCWGNVNGINVNQQVSGVVGPVLVHGNICRNNTGTGIRAAANQDHTTVENLLIVGNMSTQNGTGLKMAASTSGVNRVISGGSVVGNVFNDQQNTPSQQYGIDARWANVVNVAESNNLLVPNAVAPKVGSV